MNLHSPGWFQRYLQYRLEEPVSSWQYKKMAPVPLDGPDYTVLNERFYDTVRRSGVLFGSPVPVYEETKAAIKTHLLSDKDKARLINLDVLFTCLIVEIRVHAPGLGDHKAYFSRALIRIIQFYFGMELDSTFFGLDTATLLKNKSFRKILSSFERQFARRVRILTKFTLVSTLQNSSVFLDIYGLIQWNRLFNQRSRPPVYFLQEIEADHIRIQIQLCLIFAGIIWDAKKEAPQISTVYTNVNGSTAERFTSLSPKKALMLKRYVQTTRLPNKLKHEILSKIKKPVTLNSTKLSISEPVIINYMLEQTILLSLINSDTDPFLVPFITDLGKMATIDTDGLRARISSVADFFHKNEDRFDFIRGSRALQHMKENLNHRLTFLIRKNLSRIVTEIKLTGELYSVLTRHDGKTLTIEEKKFVREQLLSIAKTIPAIAIFCLPAGGMVLTVLIKVLPFNILPNSFAD